MATGFTVHRDLFLFISSVCLVTYKHIFNMSPLLLCLYNPIQFPIHIWRLFMFKWWGQLWVLASFGSSSAAQHELPAVNTVKTNSTPQCDGTHFIFWGGLLKHIIFTLSLSFFIKDYVMQQTKKIACAKALSSRTCFYTTWISHRGNWYQSL